MGMQDHLGPDGTVTADTIRETAKEQITIAREGQRDAEARGDSYTAALLADAVDIHLDRINDSP